MASALASAMAPTIAVVQFVKGHGTRNDFVLLPDPEGRLALDAALVAALCDRRAGVGADGVLRVVRSVNDPAAAAYVDDARWFMDYRNADGSVAEMCGNGIRVYGRYLVEAGLEPAGEIPIATRDGIKRVTVPAAGDVTVDMGGWSAIEGDFTVGTAGHSWSAVGLSMGNPHVVAGVAQLSDAGALREVPDVEPGASFPTGVNVEFVADVGPRHIAMRVHERGVGETQSCGTGACAAAVAASRRHGDDLPVRYTVDVPGGRLAVTVCEDRTVLLSGPAVLVADGEVRIPG